MLTGDYRYAKFIKIFILAVDSINKATLYIETRYYGKYLITNIRFAVRNNR